MRAVGNYFSNSQEFLKKFGKQLVDAAPGAFKKGIETAADQATKFSGDVYQNLKDGTYTTRFGNQTYSGGTPFSSAAGTVSDVIGKTILSDKFRQQYVWPYTNAFRVVSKAGVAASKLTGLENPVAAGAVAAGVPIFIHTMTETSGPITQGLRPKGYKAVAPVSKEEDPTGAKPRNIAEEAALRFIGGQKSQPLAYKDFIKERPDVMPSTISDYRRYMNRKPEAGKRIDIDPEKQTFTAYGGFVRGTARGLNDPEIRVRGVPISASSVLGAAAGVATVKAGKKFLDPKGFGVEVERPIYASDIKPDISGGTGLKTPAEMAGRFKMQGPVQDIPENYRQKAVVKEVGKTVEVGTMGRRNQDGTPSYYGPKYGEEASPRIPNVKIEQRLQDLRDTKKTYDAMASDQLKKGDQLNIPGIGDSRSKAQEFIDASKAVEQEIGETTKKAAEYAKQNFSKAAQQFQKLGKYKEPALVAGGLVAAVGTAAIAKKLFQKAEQERIKKEDPLQYKKYKRGDYTKE